MRALLRGYPSPPFDNLPETDHRLHTQLDIISYQKSHDGAPSLFSATILMCLGGHKTSRLSICPHPGVLRH